MDSRSRLKTALAHREPDRVPTAFSASPWAVERLKGTLRVRTDRDLLQALHVDIFDMRGIDLKGAVAPRYIGPANPNISPDWNGDVLALFGYAERVVDTPFGKMYSMGPAHLAPAQTLAELEDYPWPDPDWFDYSTIRTELEAWSDFAIACTGCSFFQHPTFLRGLDNLLVDMAVEPELATFLLDRFTDFYYEYYRRIFEQAGDLINIFRIADDLGAQTNLLISPQMVEQYFAPRIRRFADLVRAYDIKLLFHSDGNIRPLIPRLIELGVDILDPLQPEVTQMDAAELKQEFGDCLCFMGGISAQYVLSQGTIEEVQAEVRQKINLLAPGGGYILSPGHPVLQVDIPTENILTMYETAFEYGRY